MERFPIEFFQGVAGYNRLMLNPMFYHRFTNYEYMLIYQLDGFVFTGNLDEFFNMNIDYIGAPWPGGVKKLSYEFKHAHIMKKIFPFFNKKLRLFVGNGGVSLRRIKVFQSILEKYSDQFSCETNEDVLFSKFGAKHPKIFRVANVAQAMDFSFEMSPDEYYEMHGKKLPAFCHAWEKHNTSFWRPIFKQYGYEI